MNGLLKTGKDMFGMTHAFDEGGDRISNDRPALSIDDWDSKMRRLVAAWNACAGIPTETLERDSVRVGVRAVVAEEALKEIRDVAAYCRADGRIGSEDLALIEKYVETGLKPETGREAEARADEAVRLLEWAFPLLASVLEHPSVVNAMQSANMAVGPEYEQCRAFLEGK